MLLCNNSEYIQWLIGLNFMTIKACAMHYGTVHCLTCLMRPMRSSGTQSNVAGILCRLIVAATGAIGSVDSPWKLILSFGEWQHISCSLLKRPSSEPPCHCAEDKVCIMQFSCLSIFDCSSRSFLISFPFLWISSLTSVICWMATFNSAFALLVSGILSPDSECTLEERESTSKSLVPLYKTHSHNGIHMQ